MIHSAFFWELSNLFGTRINQALSFSVWKLYRQLIHSSMLIKANRAHSQKELGRVSYSCSHSYSQPHKAMASVELTGMLMGPLLRQFNSQRSRKNHFFAGLVFCYYSELNDLPEDLSPTASPRYVVAHADRNSEWDHFDSIFGSLNWLLNFQFMFRRFISGERGALSHLLPLASRKLPQIYPYPQQNLKN